MSASAPTTSLPADARLEALEVAWADGRRERCRLDGGPRIALDRGPFAEAGDLGLLIADVLGGDAPRRDVLNATIHFGTSDGRFALRRDFERDQVLLATPAGEERRIEGAPVQELFGIDRGTFRRTALLRGGDHAAVGGGRDALAAALRRLFGVAEPKPRDDESRRREAVEAEGKLREIESALKELKAQDAPMAPVSDPPELGALLESLEESREIDRRLIARRLELARELAALEEGDEAPGSPTREALRELRDCMRLTEANERERADLRKRSADNRGMAALNIIILIGLMAASGLMLAGHFVLDDAKLTHMGLRAAGGMLALAFVAWLSRGLSVFRLTGEAKAAGQRAERLAKRSRTALRDLGTSNLPERVDAKSLRELYDRLGQRDIREGLTTVLSPFIDEADEIQWLRQLEMGLSKDLGEVAAGAEAGPGLPLIRATDQVLSLARAWNEALERNRNAVAIQVEMRVRQELEEEMLNKARRRLEARLTELKLRGDAPEKRGDGDALARRIEKVVVPALAEIIGDGSPRQFDENLRPRGGYEPDAETNALTLFLSRLLLRSGPAAANRHLGTIFVDPGVALSPARERAFIAWLAREPRLGRLTILASRPEVLLGMRRRGGGDWMALVREVRSEDLARKVERKAAPQAGETLAAELARS